MAGATALCGYMRECVRFSGESWMLWIFWSAMGQPRADIEILPNQNRPTCQDCSGGCGTAESHFEPRGSMGVILSVNSDRRLINSPKSDGFQTRKSARGKPVIQAKPASAGYLGPAPFISETAQEFLDQEETPTSKLTGVNRASCLATLIICRPFSSSARS